MIVGLDLGYGYVKVTADGRNTYAFPSVVGTGRRRELTGLFGGGRGMDEMAVEIEGRVHYVGDLAVAESYDASRPLARDKTRHDATRILVAAAMLLLPPWSDEEGVRLYTGLPLEYVREQREELAAVLRSMRLDVRGISGPFAGVIRRVQFRDVRVFPQAIGAMYAALIDERGRPRYPELSGLDDPIALVDIGYRTTDFAVIQVHPRLRVLEELSGTIAVGAHTLYNLVRANYPEIPERDVEQAVRRGEIWIGGRLLDLRREVAESKAAVARTIVDELQHRWSERVRRFRTVFLAGGGAQLFEHGLRGLHPDVRMIEHAQAANAAGFWIMGNMLGTTGGRP